MGKIVPFSTVQRERRPQVRPGQRWTAQQLVCLPCTIGQLQAELLTFAPRYHWTPSDWALHSASLHVQITNLRRAIYESEDLLRESEAIRFDALFPVMCGQDCHCLVHLLAITEAELVRLMSPDISQRARAQSIARFGEARRHLISLIGMRDRSLLSMH